ncbi:beta strand repeat-containing protein [Aestuariibius sp. 2305UL40-4]|uniref:beta strand repeat-containing protein n=1 Tax=Aestuariibius violaceus TaxID=3234132 RepID=UPI00398ED13A
MSNLQFHDNTVRTIVAAADEAHRPRLSRVTQQCVTVIVATVMALFLQSASVQAQAQDLNGSCPAQFGQANTSETASNGGLAFGLTENGDCRVNSTVVGGAVFYRLTHFDIVGFPGFFSFPVTCAGGSRTVPYGETRTCSGTRNAFGFTYNVNFTVSATRTSNGNGTDRVTVSTGPSTYSRTAIVPNLTVTAPASVAAGERFVVTLTSDQPIDDSSIGIGTATLRDINLVPINSTTSISIGNNRPVRISATEYTITFFVSGGTGTVRPQIFGERIRTTAGASGAGTIEGPDILVDGVRPTPVLSGLAPLIGVAGEGVTVDFGEEVTGFALSDLDLENLRASGLATTDNQTFTFDVVPIADGPVRIALPSDVVTDAVGNQNAAGNILTSTADATPPEFSLADVVAASDVGQFTAIFTATPGAVASTAPTAGSVTPANATIDAIDRNGADLSVTFIPANSSDAVSLSINAGLLDEPSGNQSVAQGPFDLGVFDVTGPDIVLASAITELGPAGGTVTATFSEDVTGFEIADLDITNGQASDLTGGPRAFSFTVVPDATGPMTLLLPAGSATDPSRNPNVVSNTLVLQSDLSAPTAAIADFTGALNGPQTAVITLSDTTTDFALDDLVLTNATAVLTGSGASYTAVLTPITDGPVALSVAAAAFTDAAGNPSVASNEVTSTADLTAPTPTITYIGYDSVAPFTAVVTFDEDVMGFDVSDITAVSATLSAFAATTPGRVFTVTVTGGDILSPPSIAVPADAAADLAGNLSVAAVEATPPPPDGDAPAVSITGVPDSFSAPMTTTITFDWGEPVGGFDLADITVTGGTLSAISGGPDVYTAELAVDGDTDVTVSVAAAAALDSTGTASAAASVTGMFASGSVAEEVIREFMAARAAALIAAQPGLAELLGKSDLNGNILVTRGAGTVQIHTGSERPVWAALDANWSDLDGFETAYTKLSFGAHTYLQDETLLGMMLQLDHAVSNEGLAEVEGTGWLVGPYFVARYGGIDVDARLLWGRTSNEISPIGTYSDTFATERALAMVNLSGEIEAGTATLRPLVGWAYVEDRSEAYIDELSNPVAAQRVRLGQLEAALDWTMPVGAAGIEFSGGVAGLFTSEDGGNGSVEGTRGRIDMGLRRQGTGPFDFDIGVYADGLGQSEFEAYGAELSFAWQF